MNIHAVFIDTVSIQRYVFGSNKLKENLGGSYLIEEVYESYLRQVVKGIFPSGGYDTTFLGWRENPKVILIERSDIAFEIGYIGGGNALLLFKDKTKVKTFVKEWTKILLLETPGIVTAVACDAFDLGKFQSENDRLFKKLQEHKRRFIPQTIIPRHGITAECSHTGYSMDVWNDEESKDEHGYVSSVAYTKICASQEANKKLNGKFSQELGSSYGFTDQLDNLGQQKGEDSHIAIVHIDGNGMGERFRKASSLETIRSLSTSVKNATEESLRSLLKEITSKFDDIQNALGFDTPEKKLRFPKAKNKGEWHIPLRPIIIGGDDITFVCDGRLGVYFAKIFLEAFEKLEVRDGKKLSACAGIAITKTKYPFYRGYELAEQLCKNAKKRRKNEGKNEGSWLDYHIAYSGFSGTLDDIRDLHYEAIQGTLIYGPYKLGKDDKLCFDTLIENIKTIKNKFPRTKVKELRQVLTLGKEVTKRFMAELTARGLKLEIINSDSLFENRKTPYFDMIELMEYYPSFELTDNKKEVKHDRVHN
ncbi:MAG: hypothetical protein U0586_16595 [Candidatus Brocadiaceae bacterium]